jgi:hypothetical protein
MRVLGDIVARERRSDDVALRVDATGREYSYRDFCTTAWKAGHALSHLGVHAGSRVALTPDPAPQPLLTLFGAACLGARVTFDTAAEARAVLVPARSEGDVEDRPSRKVIVYGDAPTDPGVAHWEGTVWSENPAMPPGERAADENVLDADGRSFTHRDVLRAAEAVVEGTTLDADASVALRAPLTDPRAIVAGVVAPLSAGGTVVLPDGEAESDAHADVTVGDAEGGSTPNFHISDVRL